MEELKSKIPFHCLITGPTNCGKTQYLVDMLRGPFRGVFDFIVLICPTFAVNETYEGFANLDKCFFVMMPKTDEIEECLEICGDLFHNNKETKVLLILDDCAVSADVKKRTSKLIDLAFSGRHIGISVWVLTQQLTSIAKPFRENLGCVVAFHNPESDGTDSLFKKFGSGIDHVEKSSICGLLKQNKYSRVCFSLLHPFHYNVEIPHST